MVGSPSGEVVALFDVVVEDELSVVGAGQHEVSHDHCFDLVGSVEGPEVWIADDAVDSVRAAFR